MLATIARATPRPIAATQLARFAWRVPETLSSRRSLTRGIVPALAAAAIAAAVALVVVGVQGRPPAPEGCAMPVGEASAAVWSLRDVMGAPRTAADFRGAPTVLAVSPEPCGEACAAARRLLENAEAALSASGATVQPGIGAGPPGAPPILYVFDRDWRVRALIEAAGRTPEEVVACVRASLALP